MNSPLIGSLAASLVFVGLLPLASMAQDREEAGLQAVRRPEPFVIEGLAPRPSLALYIVVGDEPVTARLSVRQGRRAEGDRLMVRAFDPGERLTFWQYVEAGRAPQPFIPGEYELWGIPLEYEVEPKPGDLMFDADIRLDGAGVHHIRIVAGAHNAVVSLELPRELPYGVSFQNGDFSAWTNAPAAMHVYMPPRAEELRVAGGPLRLIDERGNLLAETPPRRQTVTAVAVANAETVWRVEFVYPGQWRFNTWDVPFILCSTPEAARAIRASVEVLPDGTVVSHRFQRRIAELLPGLLAPENVGTADELIIPLSERREAWLDNPNRNRHLLSAYGPLAGLIPALRHQNLDPGSHWGGAMGAGVGGDPAGWHNYVDRPDPENRWDRWRTLRGVQGGLSPWNSSTLALAFAATLDAPLNPYYGRRELLNRAAAAALRDLMTVGEDELMHYGRGTSPYPGHSAFVLGQMTLPVYAMVAPHMPDDVREVWTEAVRRLVDRVYPDNLVTTRNQSSHYLVINQEFFEGSGLPRYEALARAYARRFIQGMSPAGWAEEAKGPDATYNGMTHWHMAVYYRKSGDEAMGEALRASYRFFNHTVAPEPGGGVAGASNFSHRTLGGFHMEQWGGARGLADHLPEVGLWAGPEPAQERLERQDREHAEHVERLLDNLPAPLRPDITGPRYTYYNEQPNRTAVWPALEEAPFIRNFGGEMVAVRRPAYYAAVYVGKPADPWYIRQKEQCREPYPDDAENRGGEAISNRMTPFLGGGLSLLATPGYGNALLAKNWAPTTHHGLIATLDDGTRYWTDYHRTGYRLDEQAGTLTVTGRIEGRPLSTSRAYRFLDDAVEVRVTIVAEAAVRLAGLVENIPVAMGGLKARGTRVAVQAEAPANWPEWTPDARGAQIRDRDGVGLDIIFDEPQALRIQPNGMSYRNIQIGRVEIQLPSELRAGQQIELVYRLTPVN